MNKRTDLSMRPLHREMLNIYDVKQQDKSLAVNCDCYRELRERARAQDMFRAAACHTA